MKGNKNQVLLMFELIDKIDKEARVLYIMNDRRKE